MAWLFVIGVSVEIAGAMLVTGSLLLPIFFRRWGELAMRGQTSPRGGPVLDDMLEPAYAATGAVLLVAGFATQLTGYVVEFHRDSLLGAAIATAVGTFVAGILVAQYVVAQSCSARRSRMTPRTAQTEVPSHRLLEASAE